MARDIIFPPLSLRERSKETRRGKVERKREEGKKKKEKKKGTRELEGIQSHHAHGNIGVLDHLAKLLKADFAVKIFIGFHHRFVNNLQDGS